MRNSAAVGATLTVATSRDLWVPLVRDKDGKVRGRVFIPSAALYSENSSSPQISEISFLPVPKSELTSAGVAPGTLLSAAFRCYTPSKKSVYNLTFEASADVPVQVVSSDILIPPQDICLAFKTKDSTSQWTCAEDNYDTRVATNNQPWQDDSNRPRNVLRSNFSVCDDTIYAFIYSPLGPKPIPPTPVEPSFFEQNQTPIIAGLVGGLLFLIFMAYVGWRLYRYYAKYKEQEKELELVEVEKDEAIERDQGLITASNENEHISYQLNPMVVQMRNLDEQLEEVTKKMGVQRQQDDRRIWELDRRREQILQEKKQLQARIEADRIRERDDILLKQRMAASANFGTTSSHQHYDTQAHVGYGGETNLPRMQSANREDEFAPIAPKKRTFQD